MEEQNVLRDLDADQRYGGSEERCDDSFAQYNIMRVQHKAQNTKDHRIIQCVEVKLKPQDKIQYH